MSRTDVARLVLDRRRLRARVRGRAIPLTSTEFKLLAVLVSSPGRVFRRRELLARIWGENVHVGLRTVDVHLARLRAKFLAAGVAAPDIDTVHGVGYRFRSGRTESPLVP